MTSRYIYEENEEIPLKLADVYTNATDIVNVSIVVDSPLYIDFRFANVIKLPGIEMPENAYRVYEFVFTKFGTRTKVEPKNAIVTFRVANSWIERADKAGDVRLFEYLNNSWVEHPTELLGVKDSFTYFKSSFNHSGFYYLGYPEVREKAQGMETNENGTQNVNSSSNLFATNITTGNSNTNSTNTSSSNSTSQPEQEVNLQGALQESVIGNIVNDILNFLSNLIQTIKSFLGI